MQEETIKVFKYKFQDEEVNAVFARQLYKKLEVKKDFTDWFKAQIIRAGLEENIDYIVVWHDPLKGVVNFISKKELLERFSNTQQAIRNGWKSDYILTMESAKHISMMSGTVKGKEARNYFIQVEKEYRTLLTYETKPVLKNWDNLRIEGKSTRNELTDIIKEFIEYAKKQGSKNADLYYRSMTITTYKALTFIEKANEINDDQSFRNGLTKEQLKSLEMAELIVLKTMKSEMAKKISYKEIYQIAKNKMLVFVESVNSVFNLKIEIKEPKQLTFNL